MWHSTLFKNIIGVWIKCRFSHFGFYTQYKNQFIRKKKIQKVDISTNKNTTFSYVPSPHQVTAGLFETVICWYYLQQSTKK